MSIGTTHNFVATSFSPSFLILWPYGHEHSVSGWNRVSGLLCAVGVVAARASREGFDRSVQRGEELRRKKEMAFDIGTGINAAKKSFTSTGLPLMVGAFVVALIMAFLAGQSS